MKDLEKKNECFFVLQLLPGGKLLCRSLAGFIGASMQGADCAFEMLGIQKDCGDGVRWDQSCRTFVRTQNPSWAGRRIR